MPFVSFVWYYLKKSHTKNIIEHIALNILTYILYLKYNRNLMTDKQPTLCWSLQLSKPNSRRAPLYLSIDQLHTWRVRCQRAPGNESNMTGLCSRTSAVTQAAVCTEPGSTQSGYDLKQIQEPEWTERTSELPIVNTLLVCMATCNRYANMVWATQDKNRLSHHVQSRFTTAHVVTETSM